MRAYQVNKRNEVYDRDTPCVPRELVERVCALLVTLGDWEDLVAIVRAIGAEKWMAGDWLQVPAMGEHSPWAQIEGRKIAGALYSVLGRPSTVGADRAVCWIASARQARDADVEHAIGSRPVGDQPRLRALVEQYGLHTCEDARILATQVRTAAQAGHKWTKKKVLQALDQLATEG